VVADGPEAFVPFDTIRPGQRAFLTDARQALESTRFLLAHAPTGMGKTAVALAAALYRARERGWTVLFLTSKQAQHRMAVDTLRRMKARGVDVTAVDLIAKQATCLRTDAPTHTGAFQGFCAGLVRNNACSHYRPESRTIAAQLAPAVLHVQEAQALCRAYGVCPHKVALEAARDADVVVADYNHLFTDAREGILGRSEFALEKVVAIIDEAHNLPDRIRSHGSADLTPRLLERARREASRVDRRLARTLSKLGDAVGIALRRVGEEEASPEFLGDLLEEAGAGDTVLELATVLDLLGAELARHGGGSAVLQVAAFLDGWRARKGMVRIARGGDDARLSYRLLDPSVVTTPVFAKLPGGLLMSGTLHPVEMYADLLGVPRGRREFRRYASPFDPAKRLLVASRYHTSSYASRGPATYHAMAVTMAATWKTIAGNAAAFLPSYDFAARVATELRRLSDRPALVENPAWTKEDRDAALQWLEGHRDPGGILIGVLGGGMSEGYDYVGNLLRLVFLIGLPLSPPSVEAKALQRHYAERFGSEKGYEYAALCPAAVKILQAAGRPIRAESDRAAIVLMESRLLEPRYRKLFPEDFDYRETPDVPGAVKAFFEEPPESRVVT